MCMYVYWVGGEEGEVSVYMHEADCVLSYLFVCTAGHMCDTVCLCMSVYCVCVCVCVCAFANVNVYACACLHFEGFRPEWCISTIYHA